jgi:hypothetical protein
VPGCASFWSLSPYEIGLTISAYNAQLKADQEHMDQSAWMIGYYTGWAVNNGKKYPKKPCLYKSAEAPEAMSDDQMKAAMLGIAAIHNAKLGIVSK